MSLQDSPIKTIYHGSDKVVEKPQFGYGSYDNDYGSGFYTTEDIEKARSWAVLYGNENAINNKYEIDTTNMSILYLDDYGSLAWVAELLYNRGAYFEGFEHTVNDFVDKYKIDTSKADIIIGYRAGGNYMEVVKSFLKNEISISEVEMLLKKENLKEQFVLKSKRAFEAVKYVGYEIVKDNNYEKQSIYSRREMSGFMNNRTRQIQEENYKPQGLLIEEVCKNKYDYQQEFDYLQKDMSWEEYEEYESLLEEEQEEIEVESSEQDIGDYEYEPDDERASL